MKVMAMDFDFDKYGFKTLEETAKKLRSKAIKLKVLQKKFQKAQQSSQNTDLGQALEFPVSKKMWENIDKFNNNLEIIKKANDESEKKKAEKKAAQAISWLLSKFNLWQNFYEYRIEMLNIATALGNTNEELEAEAEKRIAEGA